VADYPNHRQSSFPSDYILENFFLLIIGKFQLASSWEFQNQAPVIPGVTSIE
jgi:hypothetical protein